jgi:uroporphyrinogen decarboxylase
MREDCMEMTPKERVLCTLKIKEPDCVPIFDFIYSKKIYKHVLGKVPEYYNAEDVMNCSYKIGYDLMVIPMGGFGGIRNFNTDENVYNDEWGTTYKKETGVSWPSDAPVAFPLKDRNDWVNYRVPDPLIDSRFKEIKVAVKMARETKIAVAGSIRGPFSAAWLLFGLEGFCYLFYDDPELVDEVLGKCTDFYVQGGLKMIEEGVDAILFADDYGSVSSPMISPELHKKHIIPQLIRMINVFKKAGVPVIMHSDGNISPLLKNLVEAGISAYHPMERKAGMNIDEIKSNFGKKICLIGNVDNKSTLLSGSKEDVCKEVIECIRRAAPDGGFILASDHSLNDMIPIENVFALYETGRKYGKYPINI